jgi:hypothetical protein
MYNSELRQKYLDILVRGFANRVLSWDTLDAGRGNNKADDMIRSTLSVSTSKTLLARSDIRDYLVHRDEEYCIKIIVGICADKVYIDRLSLGKIAAYSVLSRKVTLLTNHSTHPVYHNWPMKIISFEDVLQGLPLNPAQPRYFPLFTKAYQDSR